MPHPTDDDDALELSWRRRWGVALVALGVVALVCTGVSLLWLVQGE